MTERLKKTFGLENSSTVTVRKTGFGLDVSAPIRGTTWGNEIVHFSLEDVAALLGRETLEEMLDTAKRQERFSGVKSLEDIGGDSHLKKLEHYHDVQEDGPPLPEKDGDETVEIKRKHLRALRKGANRYPYHSSVEEAIRETSECDLL